METFYAQFIEYLMTWSQTQLNNNDYLIAVLAGGLLYVVRGIPTKIWHYVRNRSTVSMTVTTDEDIFYPILQEVEKGTIDFLSRNKKFEDNGDIGASFGRSYCFMNNYLGIVDRQKEDSDSHNFKQVLTITFLFMSVKSLRKNMERIVEKNKPNRDKIKISSYKGHNITTSYSFKRSQDTLYIPHEQLKRIEGRLDSFMKEKEWYIRHGIPYKLGIILHGPPGTGKTSLIKYIAAYTDRKICAGDLSTLPHIIRDLSRQDFYNEDVSEQKNLIVMEDIDCAGEQVNERNEDNRDRERPLGKVSLSESLNILDGINSPEDVIFVASTNNLETLDKALIRKGRFDILECIDYMQKDEIVLMISNFYKVDESKVKKKIKGNIKSSITGADLQNQILENLDDMNNVIEWILDA